MNMTENEIWEVIEKNQSKETRKILRDVFQDVYQPNILRKAALDRYFNSLCQEGRITQEEVQLLKKIISKDPAEGVRIYARQWLDEMGNQTIINDESGEKIENPDLSPPKSHHQISATEQWWINFLENKPQKPYEDDYLNK